MFENLRDNSLFKKDPVAPCYTAHKVLIEKSERQNILKKLIVDGRTQFKLIIRKEGERVLTGFMWHWVGISCGIL